MKQVTIKLSRKEALAAIIALSAVKHPSGWQQKASITLSREEALVAAIALSTVKHPYGWQQKVLAKINKALSAEEEVELV